MKRLRNTFIAVAEKDESISEHALICEIVDCWDVSFHTAKSYINELLEMKFIRKSDGMLWLNGEDKVRRKYLPDSEQKPEESK